MRIPVTLSKLLRRSRRTRAAVLDEALAEFGDVTSEHAAVTERMRVLEQFIASVPESIERSRVGRGDFLPPPDYSPGTSASSGEPTRLSRRQRRDRRLRALSGAAAAGVLLVIATGLVYILFRLATSLGAPAV